MTSEWIKAERQASAAAGSGSAADAGGSQLHAVGRAIGLDLFEYVSLNYHTLRRRRAQVKNMRTRNIATLK
jgi:hypothetical protein